MSPWIVWKIARSKRTLAPLPSLRRALGAAVEGPEEVGEKVDEQLKFGPLISAIFEWAARVRLDCFCVHLAAAIGRQMMVIFFALTHLRA